MKRSRLGNWLLGGLLSSGFAAVWLYIATLTGEWITQREMQTQAQPDSKHLIVLPSGEPAMKIHSYEPTGSGGMAVATRHETLDGQPLIVDEKQLTETWFCGHSGQRQNVMLNRSFSQYPQQWPLANLELPPELRVTAFVVSNAAQSVLAETWFFVWPRGTDTTGYFVNYHPSTKKPWGYLGTSGWSATVPALAQRFPARSREDGRFAEIIGSRGGYEALAKHETPAVVSDANDRSHSVLSLLTPDRSRLFMIDFTEAQSGSPMAVRVARDFGDDRPLSVSVSQSVRGPEQTELRPSRCVLTFADRVELTNHLWESGRIVRLPPEVKRGTAFGLHETEAGIVVQTHHYQRSAGESSSTSSLLWLSDNGEVTRRESFEQRQNELHPSWVWYAPQAISLMPAVPLSGAVTAPFQSGFWNKATQEFELPGKELNWTRYVRLLADHFTMLWVQQGWWALLTCGIAGVACASLCWRRERSRGASRAELIAWPALVFLFGPAGWLGYLTHRS